MIYKRGDSWHMDITVSGVRYRESLNTTDKREAKDKEKDRIAAIKSGKGTSRSGRDLARKPIAEAAQQYLEERKPHTSAQTQRLEKERLKPVLKHFDKPLARVRAEHIAAYQTKRLADGVSNRTVNMEVGVLRQMLKRAKRWNAIAEDVKMLPESSRPVAKVLTEVQKRKLFETAASRDEWMVAYCAAVIAVSTTCRGVELKNLRWRDVDLQKQDVIIRRSKTDAGERHLPLNRDAVIAFARLWQRAELLASTAPEHYVFPACQRAQVDALKPQRTWRTAWRKLVAETARQAGRDAASVVFKSGFGLRAAINAFTSAAAPFRRLRFHDLRHQAITELAEKGVSDATLMAMAGHLSQKMLEHYSHVRMDAKRQAVDGIASGLIQPSALPAHASAKAN
jgi:integrase